METRLLPAGSDLLMTVAEEVLKAGPPFDSIRIVFPGARPGRFLLGRIAAGTGTAFLPPGLHSVESLTDELFHSRMGRMDTPLESLDAVALLHAMAGRARRDFDAGAFKSFATFFPLGMKLYSELEEIKLAGVSPERLEDAAGRLPLPEARLLSDLYNPFYKEVAKLGRCTAAMRAEAVADADPAELSRPEERIIAAGLFRVSYRHAAILRGLLARNGLLILCDGPGIGRITDMLGASRDRVAEPYAQDTPKFAFTDAPDLHSQVFAAAGLLRQCIERGEPLDERTLVLLPSADPLLPVLQQLLPALESCPANVSLGYQLSRAPAYAFLSSLFETLKTRRNDLLAAREYLRFALHPFTKNIRFGRRADVTRILFHTLEREFFGERRHARFRLADIENDTACYKEALKRMPADAGITDAAALREHLVSIHRDTIARFETVGDLGSFASAVIDVLTAIAERGAARMHPDFGDHADRLLDAMRRIELSEARRTRLESIEEYISFFRSFLADEVHHLPGTPVRGLQILGTSETRCLTFDRIIVLNAVDDALPGGPGAPPLLPPSVREALGVPQRNCIEHEITYTMHQLLAGCREAHFFYSSGSGKERSRFVEAMIWKLQKTGGEINSAVAAPSIRLEGGPPGPLEKTPRMAGLLRGMRYSASSLDAYLACPRRFYYRHALDLNEKRNADDRTGAVDIGTFVHGVLQEFHQDHISADGASVLSPADADTVKMDGIVDRLFHETFAYAGGDDLLLYSQVRRRMRDYVVRYMKPLVESHEVSIIAAEKRLDIGYLDAIITGKIDRIEHRDGDTVIMDYKTGSSSSSHIFFDRLDPEDPATWRQSISSMQLPVYAMLYMRAANADALRLRPMLLFLDNPALGAKYEAPLLADRDDPVEAFSKLERVVCGLIDEITDPSMPFLPPQETGMQLTKVCRNCPYRVMCGTQWLRFFR